MRKILPILAALLFAAPALAADSEIVRTRGAQFGFVALNVADMEKSLAFYKGLLGLTEQFRNDTPAYLEVGVDFPDNKAGPRLLLVAPKNRKGPIAKGDGFSRISLYVTGIEAVVARLQAGGAEIARPLVDNKKFKVKIAFAKDPDGYSVELLENYD